MSAFEIRDVEWRHVDRLVSLGYSDSDATLLAFAALSRRPIPPYCPLGVALEWRRTLRPPSEPS